jgi:hypothetical protein
VFESSRAGGYALFRRTDSTTTTSPLRRWSP